LTAFVIDASIVIAWFLSEDIEPWASALFETLQTTGALAPVLIRFEVRNALLVGERRGRLDATQSSQFLRDFDKLRLRLAPPSADEALMAVARAHRLSAYDAAYLHLAKREGLALATLDRGLERAARAEGVNVIGA
jgi:predicted nucleic acid-binding protein